MPLLNLKLLLDHASEHNYAVPAFNFCNLEQMQAILEAAHLENSPVILQVSAGGRKYASERMIKAFIDAALDLYPKLPIVLHQDHGHTVSECFRSIRMGYTSVMMDGSLDKNGNQNSLIDNINITKKVVEFASEVGVSVEGEIGCLGKINGAYDSSSYLTSVDDAKLFVSETNVDALAIAIGTSHGAYKFNKMPTDDVLSMPRLKELHQALPNVAFVLHGSSSVPQDYLNIVREFGGDIADTYGVPIENMQEAINFGVRKFNIDTDLRIVSMAVMRQMLAQQRDCLDPRKINKKIVNELIKIVRMRYNQLRSSNQASSILKKI